MNWSKIKEYAGTALSKVSHKWIAWSVVVLLGMLLALLKGTPTPPLPPAPDEPVIVIEANDAAPELVVELAVGGRGPNGLPANVDPPRVVHTGWRRDPVEVAAVKAQLPFPVFADTPAGKADDPLPNHAYLWEPYRKLKGTNPPGKNQRRVGSCVSFGTNTAIERTMATDIVVNKSPYEFKFIAEEVTYAGSRFEIGGGRLSGDGSVGAWAARFVKEYGVVSRGKHNQYDLSNYDEDRCRKWGRTGVPDELEPLAREHPVQEITQVRNWTEAKKAMASGYGIAACSNQGFSQRRDARGVAAAQGNWMHCMALDGYHIDEQGREYGHIENSWDDDYFSGPTGWGEPGKAGFWADARVIDRMLRQGDSWAFSAVKGFPARKIDWYAFSNRRRPQFPMAVFSLSL